MLIKGELGEAQLEEFATIDLPDPTIYVRRMVWDSDDEVIKISNGVTWVTQSIPNGSITAAKLASDAVETAKILDGNVTLAKLAAAVAEALVPTGSILEFGGSSAPSGYLMCDGAAVSRTTYADLFAVIATAFGAGDTTTTFNLPDHRNVFARGVNASTRAISGVTYPAVVLGATVLDKAQGHHHAQNGNTAGGGLVGPAVTTVSGAQAYNAAYAPLDPTDDGTNGTPRTGTETAPVNLGVNFIIKI